jgi:hypothetical protein
MKTSMHAVRVLTVRQPHAHLLIHGSPNAEAKDVENRPRPTSYRGTLLIQASARIDRAVYVSYIAEGIELPPAGQLVTGAIIGSVQVTDCVRDSRSRWAIPGYWHWLTGAPQAADPIIRSRDSYRCSPRRMAGRHRSAGPAERHAVMHTCWLGGRPRL